MFRTISILGLGVACLIVALLAMLIDIRIATDESWKVEKVVFITFLSIAVVILAGVYIGRRREVRQQRANSAAAKMVTPRS